jgi:hypothetical protein
MHAGGKHGKFNWNWTDKPYALQIQIWCGIFLHMTICIKHKLSIPSIIKYYQTLTAYAIDLS